MATQFDANLPSWLTVQPNIGGLRKYIRDLPQQFDTSGMAANIQGQQQMNVSRGTAQAAAAAAAAQNRAARSGGAVASSFAQGSMMMPVMEQNQRLSGDLAQYQGEMQSRQSSNRLSALQAMAQIRAQQMGLRANFTSDAARLAQQNQQFTAGLGLDRERLAEQGRQYNMDFGFRQRQYGDQQDAMEQQMLMQQAAMQKPRAANYNVNTLGNPMSIADAQRMNWVNQGGDGGSMGFGRTQAPSRLGLIKNAAMRATTTAMRGFGGMPY